MPIRLVGRSITPETQVLLFTAFKHNLFDQDVTPLDRCVNPDCLIAVFLAAVYRYDVSAFRFVR